MSKKTRQQARQATLSKAVKGLGGKLEAFYFSLGEHDVVTIVELSDIFTAAALAMHVSDTGLVRTMTAALPTVEETNQAIKNKVDYRAPGR